MALCKNVVRLIGLQSTSPYYLLACKLNWWEKRCSLFTDRCLQPKPWQLKGPQLRQKHWRCGFCKYLFLGSGRFGVLRKSATGLRIDALIIYMIALKINCIFYRRIKYLTNDLTSYRVYFVHVAFWNSGDTERLNKGQWWFFAHRNP